MTKHLIFEIISEYEKEKNEENFVFYPKGGEKLKKTQNGKTQIFFFVFFNVLFIGIKIKILLKICCKLMGNIERRIKKMKR